MIFAITALLVNRFDLKFSVAQKWAKRFTVALSITVAIVLILTVIFISRSCSNRPSKPVMTPEQIHEVNQAIEKKNRDRALTVIAEADTAVERIDQTFKEQEAIIDQRKADYSGWSIEDIAAELERRK